MYFPTAKFFICSNTALTLLEKSKFKVESLLRMRRKHVMHDTRSAGRKKVSVSSSTLLLPVLAT